MSTCSKLYSILKSPDKLKIPSVDSHMDKNPMVPAKRLHTEGILWQCWECGKSYETGFRLSEHLQNCKKDDEVCEQLPGCPFCPRVINQSNDAPFHIHSFNTHVHRFHPEIKSYMCSYCLDLIHSCKIEDLVSHIINVHKIPWRPSPASLAHLRENQLPHRVVTCLGCGWCTFVLRANNAAQPPTSLEAHMNRCSFNGGQVHLTRLSEETCMSALEKYKVLQESELISTTFAQSFPHVRGFIGNSGLSNSPFRFHRYSGNIASRATDNVDNTSNPISNKINCLSTDNTNNKLSIKQKSKLETVLEKSDFQQKETFFDIPLTIPPPPPLSRTTTTTTTITNTTGQIKKKSTIGRLFVCPLCGDNALSSLRERDEHLQSSHNGELVFPCQICGMAYPLYIALRRHAALQHDSDFDTVRYGPSDLLECEPIECPECHLVAFQDAVVLKLHINRVHKKLQQNITLTSKDSQPVEDLEVPSKPPKISKTKATNLSIQKKTSLKTTRRRDITATNATTTTTTTTTTVNRSRTQPKISKPKVKHKLSIISGESEILTDNNNNHLNRSSLNDVLLQDTNSSEFERMLSSIDGKSAPASCRYCHIEVDNLKELHLHLELEHLNPDNDIEQLGCQVCGRVFFGSGGRIDLIGHLRALHQDDFLQNILKCPRAEKFGQDITTTTNNNNTTTNNNDGNDNNISHESIQSCKAHFSSPRLRQLHISMSNNNNNNNNNNTLPNTEFSCPIIFNDKHYLTDQIKNLILQTEIAADQCGIMILAYCCPNCSRLFVGDNVHTRFESHRSTCEAVATTTTATISDNMEESIHPIESDHSIVSSPHSNEVSDLPLEFLEPIKTSNDKCITESQTT